MLNSIATTLVPVAFVNLLGYVAGRFNFFGAADRSAITRLVLTWLLPPLLIAGIAKTPRADLLDYRIPLIFLVGLMAPFLIALFACRFALRYDARSATLKAGLLAFPDMVFMGVPILNGLFGPSSLFPILIANLVPSLLIVPLTSVLLELGSGPDKRAHGRMFLTALAGTMRKPQVWVPLLGAMLVVLNVRMPQVAINALELIGEATTGVSLFIVGLILAAEKIRFTLAVAINVFFKNLVHPAVMLAIVLAFGITGMLAREAILLTAIPSAVITTIFAEKYGVLTSESSATILATRVLSFVTIPVIIALTQRL